MISPLNETHDPSIKSWVDSANVPETDFAIQNLPFGVFRAPGKTNGARAGVAIGEFVVDVSACCDAGAFDGAALPAARACAHPTLKELLECGPEAWLALRHKLHALLRSDAAGLPATQNILRSRLIPATEVTLLKPLDFPDYTDFYASIHHATRVGKLFRPQNPLLPNYKHLPIGYHGRASSIVPSGTPVTRPRGQTLARASGSPVFGPSRRLDYELEVGFVVGQGNPLSQPVSIADAGRRVFGACLVNDWSARDIQAWEYQPLGPFLGKSFATSVSPWIVTLDALAPFRVPAASRPPGDPEPLKYLVSPEDQRAGALDVNLDVLITSEKMRESGIAPFRLSRSNLRDLYWTFAQMIAHHTSNGCNLLSGDLLATGTISGESPASRGCLLEITENGAEPVELPTGETRTFLQDGDEVIMRGYCERPGFRRIGFGECCGVVAGAAHTG